MGLLDGLFVTSNWGVKNTATVDAAAEGIKSASIVNTKFGSMIVFLMQGGESRWGKLSRDTTLVVGDTVKMDSLTVTTLEKEGEEDIIRFDGSANEEQQL